MPALAFAAQAIEFVQLAIATGKAVADIAGMVEETLAALKAMQAEGRDPTDAEWAALNARTEALRADLHAT